MLYFLLFMLLAGAGLGGYLWVQHQSGNSMPSALFGGGQNRRIELVESTSIRGGRKLLLIKRDDIEHLVMTGGPVDVVVETGIVARSLSDIQNERGGRGEPLFAPPEEAMRKPAQVVHS